MANESTYFEKIRSYFNNLNIIFYGFVGFPLSIFLAIYLWHKESGNLKEAIPENPDLTMYLGIPLALGILLIWGLVKFKKELKGVDPDHDLLDKLKLYRQLSLSKYIFLELASLLPLIGFYLTGEKLFAGLYVVGLIVFSLNRPTPLKILKDLRLSKKEKSQLYGEEQGT